MRSRSLCAPAGLWALAVVMMLTAPHASASASAATAPDPADLLGLRTTDGPDDPLAATSLSFAATAEPQEKPVTVPLPPALATGLAGFAAMAVLRVGRRVYGRR